jgi:hypothetical protein
LQIKRTPTYAIIVANRSNDVDLRPVGTGSHKARNDCIACGVLGAQENDAAARRASFTAWPMATSCHRRSHRYRNLRFPQARFACDQRLFANGETTRPQKLDSLRLDIGCASDHQLGVSAGVMANVGGHDAATLSGLLSNEAASR